MVKLFEWFDVWKDGIITGITKPIADTQTWFAEKLAAGLIMMMEKVEVEEVEYVKEMMKTAAANPELPPEFKKFLQMFEGKKAPAWFALAPIAAAILLMPTISAVFSGKLQEVQQVSNQMFTPAVLSPGETFAAWRRGLKPDTWRDQELAWQGYDKERIDVLQSITEFYPAPQDFIRFAVRDTFNEAVVKKYGYDNEYPVNIDAYVKKAGMSPDWMRHFWRAHWELPSPTQMYEMLHRSIISEEDARTLLKIADIAPAFIEPMLKISYNPYTRVDVRRMWDTGTLTKEEVKRAYMDGGYDEIRANKLTDWTISDGMKEETDLTKAEIKSAYAAGEITDSEAKDAIKKLGYDDKETDIIIGLVDYAKEKSLKTREKNVFVKKFVKNILTEPQLKSALEGLKMSDRELKVTMEEAKLQVKEVLAEA